MDATHPPTAYRKTLLAAHPVPQPEMGPLTEQMNAADMELRQLEDRLGRRLIGRFVRD